MCSAAEVEEESYSMANERRRPSLDASGLGIRECHFIRLLQLIFDERRQDLPTVVTEQEAPVVVTDVCCSLLLPRNSEAPAVPCKWNVNVAHCSSDDPMQS